MMMMMMRKKYLNFRFYFSIRTKKGLLLFREIIHTARSGCSCYVLCDSYGREKHCVANVPILFVFKAVDACGYKVVLKVSINLQKRRCICA
jgi:hypothetical protein